MKAEQTGVTSIFSAELCANCPLREGHEVDQVFIHNGGPSLTEAGTELYILSKLDGAPITTSAIVDGVRRNDVLIRAFNNCEQPAVESRALFHESVICGAVAALRNRDINGRQEIRTQ